MVSWETKHQKYVYHQIKEGEAKEGIYNQYFTFIVKSEYTFWWMKKSPQDKRGENWISSTNGLQTHGLAKGKIKKRSAVPVIFI